mmetsp:Transcript_98008/g.260387  ORF Transcript_98008/g.260387 Transcript_98008/m.260387 type:complete len:224 (-) Transcript_98008:158-829(-)
MLGVLPRFGDPACLHGVLELHGLPVRRQAVQVVLQAARPAGEERHGVVLEYEDGRCLRVVGLLHGFEVRQEATHDLRAELHKGAQPVPDKVAVHYGAVALLVVIAVHGRDSIGGAREALKGGAEFRLTLSAHGDVVDGDAGDPRAVGGDRRLEQAVLQLCLVGLGWTAKLGPSLAQPRAGRGQAAVFICGRGDIAPCGQAAVCICGRGIIAPCGPGLVEAPRA